MKKILFGLQILFLALAFPHNGEASEGILKYNDWSASSSENTAEYLVNGNTVHGHEFGFLKMAGNCNTDILWVSWSTAEKEVKSLKGIDATIQLRVGATKFQIEVPLACLTENILLQTTKRINLSTIRLLY